MDEEERIEMEEALIEACDERDSVRAELDELRKNIGGVLIELTYAGTSEGYYSTFEDVYDDLKKVLDS